MNGHIQSCWLALHRIPGVGSKTLSSLLTRYHSVENIFSAPRAELQPLVGGKSAIVDAILSGPDNVPLTRELDWLAQENHHLVTLDSETYPQLLRQIPDPPVVLFVAGDKELLKRPQVAVVGSRNPTPAGTENAGAFAGALVQAGLTITSGLALGIDGAAHAGALAANGSTIAVAATGLDRVYPARHRQLARQIAESGALVSEFPLGTEARRQHFPQRNRIISGLSLGTLVVEAAVGSGSLITARLAVDQGREVFAMPGSIHSPLARGCHLLIREGAKLVETSQDILEELGALAHYTQSENPDENCMSNTVDDPQMKTLLDYLGYDPVSIDTLVVRSGLTPASISSMLLHMELLGLVVACPDGKYLRRS